MIYHILTLALHHIFPDETTRICVLSIAATHFSLSICQLSISILQFLYLQLPWPLYAHPSAASAMAHTKMISFSLSPFFFSIMLMLFFYLCFYMSVLASTAAASSCNDSYKLCIVLPLRAFVLNLLVVYRLPNCSTATEDPSWGRNSGKSINSMFPVKSCGLRSPDPEAFGEVVLGRV